MTGLPVGAELPPECTNLAPSAGLPPVELMTYCAQFVESDAPQVRDVTDLADSPDGVLSVCATMTLNAPDVVTTVGSVGFRPACDYANNDFGRLYCFNDAAPATLSYLDPTTCTETVVGSGSNTQQINGLAWDHHTGTMYAVESDGAISNLLTVDLATGATTMVGTISGAGLMVSLGCDPNGDLYGLDLSSDVLYAIDKATAAGTVVGGIGFDANYAQGLDFDHGDGTCYVFAFNNGTFAAELRTCDTGTGATTLVGTIGSTSPGGLQDWTGAGVRVPDVPVELQSFTVE